MRNHILSVDDAYQAIARDIASFPDGRNWDAVFGQYEIYSKMVSSRCWLKFEEHIDRKWDGGDDQFNARACDAALFLRDDLLKTTEHRIWGLTFTLYSNGKFNIEYNYDKPEGYEETDEIISGAEINQSLGQLGTPKIGSAR